MKRLHNMPISESVNKQLKEIAKRFGGGHVKVGFLEGKNYPDGTPVATVAFFDEYGHGGNFPSPARPFFRNMIKNNSHQWPATLAHLSQKYNFNGPLILRDMGKLLEEQLRLSIIDTNEPDLSKTTLVLRSRFPGLRHFEISLMDVISAQEAAAKGQDIASGTLAKPLVWSGTMLASVGSQVTA